MNLKIVELLLLVSLLSNTALIPKQPILEQEVIT